MLLFNRHHSNVHQAIWLVIFVDAFNFQDALRPSPARSSSASPSTARSPINRPIAHQQQAHHPPDRPSTNHPPTARPSTARPSINRPHAHHPPIKTNRPPITCHPPQAFPYCGPYILT
ncbi:hypothetical protein DPMN_021418 [Dreissena polymorpha]|uniref:Uncharacterized protein n=1 Tax=Dreissena polymorpha TaxID=45954 RepID=A0A9D4NII3_DREPO|nr:hypothetical protein DPMN_021418 [Dreissena polymorpha]